MKTLMTWSLFAALAFSLVACSSGDSGSTNETAENVTPKADPVVQTETPTETTPPPAAEAPPVTPPVDPNRFATVYDPNATYTLSDLPTEGSFVKIQFGGMTDEQANRIVHRIKTENCTCGCPKDTIEECLVNDPQCGTVVQLATQIIREEKAK